MELNRKFKQTDIGAIPQDWEAIRMGDIGEPIIGLTYKPSDVSEYGVLVLRSSNIQNNRLAFKDNVYVNMDIPKRVITKENDLLICVRNGSKQLIGKCALVDKKTEGSAFGAFMSVFRSGINKLMLHQFQSSIIQKQIDEVMGATINQLTNRNLREFIVPVPTKKQEQEAIANALSDADAYIESLEKLIEKKRLIKKGAMQDLLTGKRRLPGFGGSGNFKKTEVGLVPEDWQVKLLPEVCRFRSGKAHEQYIVDDGKYVCVNSKFISTDGQVRKYSSANFCAASRNDILMVMSDLPNGKALAKVFMVDRDNFYAVNQRVCALTPYKDDPEFVGLQLNRNPYFLKFDDGVSQTHLLNRVFEKCPLLLPNSIEEQRSISNIISEMTLEINGLESKLAKAHFIKQGMMQELLTGRIRLV